MAHSIYEPLDEDNLDVRFLTLLPAPRFDDPIYGIVYKASVMEDTYPVFKALSYCWGIPTPTRQITLNGSSFNVGPNLECALRHLRNKSVDVQLWVDAICINQGDLYERSSQVKLMDSMYGDAEEVVVWLGDASSDSQAAMKLVRQWSEWFETTGKEDKQTVCSVAEPFPLAFNASALAGIDNILSRLYWERVWVVQEVACVKEVTIMCGREYLSFDHFENASGAWDNVCNALHARSEDLTNYLLLDSLRRRNLQQMIRHRNYRILSYLDWDRPRTPFLEVLESCSHLKCSDPRDKIYGFLTLGGPHTRRFTAIAAPNYQTSIEDVYCGVARRLLLDDQSLRILVIASSINSCPSNAVRPLLPSWVPDWACVGRLEGLYFEFTKPNDEQSKGIEIQDFVRFSADDRILVAKGVVYDTVTKVYPSQWLDDLKLHKSSILKSFLGKQCINGIPKMQALFRAISLNIAWPNAENSESRRSFLNKAGWYLWKFWSRDEDRGQNDVTDMELALEFFHGTPPVLLLEFAEMVRSGIRWKEHHTQHDISKFWNTVRQRMLHRVLFETEGGRMGLGPPGVKIGDKICIFHGCKGAFCLEPDGVGHILKGECCLAGTQDFEFATALNSAENLDIEIH